MKFAGVKCRPCDLLLHAIGVHLSERALSFEGAFSYSKGRSRGADGSTTVERTADVDRRRNTGAKKASADATREHGNAKRSRLKQTVTTCARTVFRRGYSHGMDWKPTISSSCGNALIYYWTMITSCVCAKNATKKQMPAQYPLIFCDSLRKNETISPRTRRIFERERLYTNRGPRRKNNSQNKFCKGVRTNEPTK